MGLPRTWLKRCLGGSSHVLLLEADINLPFLFKLHQNLHTHYRDVMSAWLRDGTSCQVQDVFFSSIFSPNRTQIWLLFKSYQVAALILAVTLLGHYRLHLCTFLVGRNDSLLPGSQRSWVPPRVRSADMGCRAGFCIKMTSRGAQVRGGGMEIHLKCILCL